VGPKGFAPREHPPSDHDEPFAAIIFVPLIVERSAGERDPSGTRGVQIESRTASHFIRRKVGITPARGDLPAASDDGPKLFALNVSGFG
jgi:hypothetical protein